MSVSDRLLLRKRAIIETVNDELKNIAQVEHSRHRCFDKSIANLLGAIAAYYLFPKKPCINEQRTIDTQLALFWIRRTHVIYDNQMRLIGVKSYLPYGNPRVDMNGKASFSKDEYKFEKQDYSSSSGLYLRWSSSLSLDDRGKAAKFLYVMYTTYHSKTISKYDSLKYNSEGHLTSCYCHLYNWRVSNIWENGNLVSLSHNVHDDPPGVRSYQF